MKIGNLEFKAFKNNNITVAEPVKRKILTMTPNDQSNCYIANIDNKDMGGFDLCNKYNIEYSIGVNCLIVKGKNNGVYFYVALLVPVGYKYNINGILKEKLKCRCSVAPLDEVLNLTNMEYGSITPVGLPEEWLIFADPKIFKEERIICGGGKQISKLSLPSDYLIKYCNVKILEGLAIN